MAWADLTITRSDIDSVEGATFERYDAATTLKIAANDADVLATAKLQLGDDLIRKLDNKTYTEDGLLDALQTADNRNLLKRMLLYRFLRNWFFQDTAKQDSLSWQKAREWAGEYHRAVNAGVVSLASKLPSPRESVRYRLVR